MYTYKIYQDGKIKAEITGQENDFKAFKYLLDNQSASTNYALKWGGWKVEIINEETGEITQMKHYC